MMNRESGDKKFYSLHIRALISLYQMNTDNFTYMCFLYPNYCSP